MSAVADILNSIAPKFSSLDASVIDSTVALASLQVGPVFGTKRNLAIAYLTAHMLEIRGDAGSGGSGTGGLVTSEREGQLARNYASMGGTLSGGSPYERTVWGQEFLRLRRQCVITPGTRIGTLPVDHG